MYGAVAAGAVAVAARHSARPDPPTPPSLPAEPPVEGDPPVPLVPRTGFDPLTLLPSERSKWISASLIRQAEGFDAECLLAAADPDAEAHYLRTLVSARAYPPICSTSFIASLFPAVGDGAAGDGDLASLAGPAGGGTPPPHRAPRPPPSARLVALEALGSEREGSTRAAADLLSWALSAPTADGGTRAVAARALAQLGAQGALPGAALGGAVTALAAAARSDPDRYVRGYAVDALASIVLLPAASAASAGGSARDHDDAAVRAGAALEAALGPEDVAAARLLASAAGDAARAVRWLCSRRRCPLTTPESPF